MNFEKWILVLGVLLGGMASSALPSQDYIPTKGYCARIFQQLKTDRAIFKNDQYLADREEIGDIAIQNGIRYLALRARLSDLPLILGSSYLPELWSDSQRTAETSILHPVTSALAGKDASLFLNQLVVHMDPTEEARQYSIEAPQRRNIMVLYSPRVLSLSPWKLGNRYLLSDRLEPPVAPCAGRHCLASSNSRQLIAQRFDSFREEQGTHVKLGYGHEDLFRMQGALPRYEILTVVIQPNDQENMESFFENYSFLRQWTAQIQFSTQFPDIDPTEHQYSDDQIADVLRDLVP